MAALPQAASSRHQALKRILSRARCVVLDLDGPVVRFFARPDGSPDSVAPSIAAELLDIARVNGTVLPELEGVEDPHRILTVHDRHPGTGVWRRVALEMRDTLDSAEWKAAEHGTETDGATDFIREWRARGRHLSVASNNHPVAVTRVLERLGVLDRFDGPVVGRAADTRLMKPHPHALRLAMVQAAGGPERHVMIGDSRSDLVTAQAVGMPFIGYHRKAGARELLAAAGAPVVLESMRELLAALPD
ncbi:HAD family hydrolase [Streptomyces niveus]|uniref:HAD family hydrolase n=1 Tax=Streptomyces niveus TaxID=193462 RepID=UPI0033FACDE4